MFFIYSKTKTEIAFRSTPCPNLSILKYHLSVDSYWNESLITKRVDVDHRDKSFSIIFFYQTSATDNKKSICI